MDPYLGYSTLEKSSFDPVLEEVMTQFTLIRNLQGALLESLVNSELLRTEHRTIVKINTYYI